MKSECGRKRNNVHDTDMFKKKKEEEICKHLKKKEHLFLLLSMRTKHCSRTNTMKVRKKYDPTREVHYLHFDFRKRDITGLNTFPKDTKYRLPIYFYKYTARRMPKAKPY